MHLASYGMIEAQHGRFDRDLGTSVAFAWMHRLLAFIVRAWYSCHGVAKL